MQPNYKKPVFKKHAQSNAILNVIPTKNQLGFTLIEVMAVLAILGILITLSSFAAEGVKNGLKVESVSQQLSSSLSYAKSYALQTGLSVGVCASTSADNFCDASSWESGWSIYTYDSNAGVVSLKILRYEYPDKQISIASAVSSIKINSFGYTDDISNFTICDPKNLAESVILKISENVAVTSEKQDTCSA